MSAFFVFLILGVCVVLPKRAATAFAALLNTVSTHFGWLYIVSILVFLVFALWLLFSRYGKLRLGPNDSRPEFGRLTWFSMLFSAGIGAGLVFYGVAEPMLHYQDPRVLEGGTPEARAAALPVTIYHWGLHAWAIYVVMGLGIAYFGYRKGLPLTIRSCLHPLLGARIHGFFGHTIDTIAVLGTLFGLATALGLGVMQVSAGLSRLFSTPHTTNFQLILIAIITACAIISLVTGVNKGIRRLSEINMLLAASLMLFVLFAGPTETIVERFFTALYGYAANFIPRSTRLPGLNTEMTEWTKNWTVFYWGWWISWAPFVGMFVARISRGRTIREFVLAVLLVPTIVTAMWMVVFGGTALQLDAAGAPIAEAVSKDVSTAIYALLEQLPLYELTSGVACLVIILFFVTSSDSASLVVDMLTSGGVPDPPVWQRIFWGTVEGSCAAVLLFVGGQAALAALQAAVVSIALPFCVVMLAVIVSLILALRHEKPAKAKSRAVV